jgi:predicted PurR-regulated permease PerM
MNQDEIDLRLGRKTFFDEMWDGRAGRVLLTTFFFILLIGLLWYARETITLFLFAILFAYFLAPAVSRLERPMRGRSWAIVMVYAIWIGALVIVGFIAGPKIGNEGKELVTSLPSLLNRIASGQLIRAFGAAHHIRPAVINQVQSYMMAHRSEILGYGQALAGKLAAPATHIWWLVLIPILSVFFLKQGETIVLATIALGRSTRERGLIRSLLADMHIMLGSYILAQIILALLTLTAYTLYLSLSGAPFAFILGPIGGALEFIPVVGPAIGAVTIFLIALLSGYPHMVWLFLFLGTWRVIQDYVNAPRIMGRRVEINPLLQIFAVLVGGEVGGVVGALVAVPVVATLRILAQHIRDRPGSIYSSDPGDLPGPQLIERPDS